MGASGRVGPVYDPARGVQAAEVAVASAAEVDDAVKIAVDAAGEWGASSLSKRVGMPPSVTRADPRQPRTTLAAAVTSEHGKVLADAQGEVDRGLECVEFRGGIPQLLKGSTSSEVSSGIDVRTILQPMGRASPASRRSTSR